MSFAVCNPTDGSTITADLQVAGGEDINAVVAAATSAFRTGPWDYAGHADKIAGEPYPPEDGIYKIVTYEPLGVCAFLASFKATFLLRGWFPPGVISLVSGGVETGALPASHMDIAHINFTGSVAAGRRVQEPAGKSNLKHCILELGGKSPAIVANDAHMPTALTWFVLQLQGSISQEDVALSFIDSLKKPVRGSSDQVRRSDVLLHVIRPSRG
ncbi:hypothetical protein KXX13_009464 [Aspergillus fumigatus]|nr:hypothetical protein KXX13_009464 [Aspergillus fumigatus]KAH1512361.1 hypothetical protein KXX29_002796 [Aspergillus fumigatus]KAH1528292.1 hypothetical protein KXX18_000417 [Aspergillus fumigatus]KAH1726237.1 hypothetical protein KXX40_000317 [Aspergillus fumigatus]KAH1753765.1 hypothetical protein KXX56_008451 [Aspergillus fumigatus]